MSAYKVIETEFRSLGSLLKALADLGIKPVCAEVEKENTVGLYGYHGDLRPERCAVAIRQADVNRWSGGVSNDVGFAWDPATKCFGAIVSDYDRGNGRTVHMMDAIKQRYAYHEISRQARAKGYNVREQRESNGVIRMVLVRR